VPVAEPQVRRRRPPWARLRDDDATLVRSTQAGDEQAFAAIFERHHAPLLAYCRHMLGNRDDGEDALQQAFIKAHRALLGGTTPRDLRPWLYAIARNCCLSAIAARRPTAALEDHTPTLAGLSDEVRQREDLRELLDGIGRLPEDQRSALLLAELDDLSHQAIATVVGCPVSKVKALVYQARSALIADRDARETPCQEIREQLAVACGGELRRGPLRRHLNLCTGCRDFQLAVGAQRQSLASLLPVAPSAGLVAAILGHGSAHVAGAAGIGGAGAGASTAGGAAGTSASVTSAGTTAAGASGIATGGTAAVGTAAGASAGAGTSVGALVGGGLVTKLAVGGAIVALAAAGTVVARPRPTTASPSRVTRAQLVAFAAHRGEVAASGGGVDGPYSGAATVASPGGQSGVLARESPTALTDASGPGASASVNPFTAPASGEGAQGPIALTATGPSSIASTIVLRQVKGGHRTAGEGSSAQARKARAKLRREALRLRALRLREARRRALLRKERREALRRRHPVAPKPVKVPKTPTIPVTPAPLHAHHRHAPPSSTSLGTSGTGVGSESKETTKGQHHPPATATGAGSTKTTGTDPETSTTGTGKGNGKASSGTTSEKAGSTNGAGKSGVASGTEKSGSTSGKGKAGSDAGGEKSGSTTGNKETGTGARTGTGESESGTGAAGTSKTGDSSEQSDNATQKSEASGAGVTSGKGSTPHTKKHLLEEEQLPNL
jgi:RNA polymerase sigma factor (sigma-70 family)